MLIDIIKLSSIINVRTDMHDLCKFLIGTLTHSINTKSYKSSSIDYNLIWLRKLSSWNLKLVELLSLYQLLMRARKN